MRSARPRRHLLPALALLILAAWACPAVAQNQGPAHDAAVNLLRHATGVAPDGRHHAILRGLRSTRDPDLRPLYAWLTTRPSPDQRGHGILGLAELSPSGMIDLAQLAEIEDPASRVEIIGAALDDELLGTNEMSQLLNWNDLTTGARQAIAIRLLALGGAVDTSVFEPALTGEPADDKPGKLLERGIAGLGLALLGDRRGPAVLDALSNLPDDSQRDAVRSQVVALVLRHNFTAAGAWVFSIAKDESIDTRLRDVALRTSLRLGVEGSEALWRSRYLATESLAERIRLALIGAEAAPHVRPSMYGDLPTGQLAQIDRLFDAARAISAKQTNVMQTITALVDLGYPQANRWVIVHAREYGNDDAPAMLLAVAQGYEKGNPADRDKLVQLAVQAVATLAQQDVDAAAELLKLLQPDTSADLKRIVLTGLIESESLDLGRFVATIPQPTDRGASDLLLLLKLRSGVDPGDAGWQRVGEIITSVGRVDPGSRVQLAWYYLKHAGDAPQQLQSILQGTMVP